MSGAGDGSDGVGLNEIAADAGETRDSLFEEVVGVEGDD